MLKIDLLNTHHGPEIKTQNVIKNILDVFNNINDSYSEKKYLIFNILDVFNNINDSYSLMIVMKMIIQKQSV